MAARSPPMPAHCCSEQPIGRSTWSGGSHAASRTGAARTVPSRRWRLRGSGGRQARPALVREVALDLRNDLQAAGCRIEDRLLADDAAAAVEVAVIEDLLHVREIFIGFRMSVFVIGHNIEDLTRKFHDTERMLEP